MPAQAINLVSADTPLSGWRANNTGPVFDQDRGPGAQPQNHYRA